MSYKNPILDEIYLRIFFQEGVLSQKQFFDIIPYFKEIGLIDAEIQQGALVIPQKSGEPSIEPRIRCWDKDRHKLAQLSPDLIIVNQTKEYLGWENFSALVNDVLNALQRAGIERNITSISLHTLDKFNVPLEGFEMGSWLNCGGPMLPEWYSDNKEACDIDLGKGLLVVSGSNRQLHLKVRPEKTDVSIRFESVFHDVLTDERGFDQTLSDLHGESTRIFESIITQHVRDKIMLGPQ